MRNQFSFIIVILLMSMLTMSTACTKSGEKFLDQKQTGTLNEQLVFADSTLTMNYLNGLYAALSAYEKQTTLVNYGSLADACDEGEQVWTGTSNYPAAHNQGAITPTYAWIVNAWKTWFTDIRNANIFLRDVNKSPLSAPLKTRASAEARTLRAWYYFQLIRYYGGVPLMGDTVYTAESAISKGRNSFEECINYINAELDAAAKDLPLTSLPQDYGRITKGTALSIKARVLLYAASPWMNGGYDGADGFVATDEQKKLLGYPSYDAARWKLAADAAKAVMDLGVYSLYEDNSTAPGYGFYKMFLMRQNNEAIFQLMVNANTASDNARLLEVYWLPPSRSGQGGSFPSQQLADAFPMKNGKYITDPASGYDPKNPYVNRDPRFYYTLIYNTSLFLDKASNTQKPVYTYFMAPSDGFGTTGYTTRTGYYCRKMCTNDTYGNTERCIPIIRYAEILLNFAEAQNEYAGPGADVYNAVEAVRRRAGLSPYQLPGGLSKEQMRDYIWRERQTELAYENTRFFDIRRWKIAHKPDIVVLKGIKWVTNGSSYTRNDVIAENRVFLHPAMYYFPIPQTEIGLQVKMVQNPGW